MHRNKFKRTQDTTGNVAKETKIKNKPDPENKSLVKGRLDFIEGEPQRGDNASPSQILRK